MPTLYHVYRHFPYLSSPAISKAEENVQTAYGSGSDKAINAANERLYQAEWKEWENEEIRKSDMGTRGL